MYETFFNLYDNYKIVSFGDWIGRKVLKKEDGSEALEYCGGANYGFICEIQLLLRFLQFLLTSFKQRYYWLTVFLAPEHLLCGATAGETFLFSFFMI